MKLKNYTLMIMAILMVSMIGIGCSDDDNNPLANNAPTLDIVETAAAAGNFTTLLAAAEAAGLVDALKGEGPLTVFAPTDDAFAALPEGTVEALLQDLDALTAILTYHVVVGEVRSDKVVTLSSTPTLNGQSVNITVTGDGQVMIDNATIITKDIQTTNGIIHVIDAVILPGKSDPSRFDSPTFTAGWGWKYSFGGGWIAEAIKDGKLKWLTRRLSLYTVARLTGLRTLTTAVKAAGLKSTVKRGGPFTIFGPTNEAFGDLPAGTVEALLQDPATLSNILLYHVAPGKVTSSQVVNLTEATMANGGIVDITVNGGVMVNDANVIVVDIPARNGVIHLIDKVLLP